MYLDFALFGALDLEVLVIAGRGIGAELVRKALTFVDRRSKAERPRRIKP